MNLEINLFILNFLKFIKKYYVYRMNNNIVKMRKKKNNNNKFDFVFSKFVFNMFSELTFY